MKLTKTLLFIPAVAVFALAQNPDPATNRQHEEHQSTTTKKTETTKSKSMSSRQFNGRLVDADCDVLSSRWGPSSTSSSSAAAERKSSTTTEDQNKSAEGRPATDRTTTSTSRQESSRTETSSSADRAGHPTLRASDLEACAVKSTTTSYALAMPDGNVYRLSSATLSDDIGKNKNWSKKITNNDTKNMRVRVTGDLSGDTITVQSIK